MSQENTPVVVISAAGRAVNEILKATKAFGAAEAQFKVIQDELPSLVEQIEIKQGDLVAITEATEIAARKQKVELGLRVAENEDEVLNQLLESRDLEHVTKAEVRDLRSDLFKAQSDNKADVAKAVESALSAERNKVALKAAEEGAAVKVKSAEQAGRIESLEQQLQAAQEVASDLRKQLDAEREAGTERARAAGSMTINTAQSK